MFSQKVISRSIDTFAALAGSFEPVSHSINECDSMKRHLDSLVEIWDGARSPGLTIFTLYGKNGEPQDWVSRRDSTRHWRKSLNVEEAQWIRNERAMCRYDFDYWQTRYVWIKSPDDTIIRMSPWDSQKIFLDLCAESQDQGIAILLILLKARQLGLSREISLILLHSVIFTPHINSFVASCTEDKTNLLWDMYDFVLERQPFWMRPDETHRRENKFLEFANDSAVTLQHGQQATGIARGTTPTKAHASEIAEFDEGRVSDLIDSSLLKAMHNAPTNFLVLEGTAKGMNNWWHKKWVSSKNGWKAGRSRLRPLFLPWFVGELYPDPGWCAAHPIPSNYSTTLAPWAETHARMAETFVEKTDYLQKRLGSNWQMPLKQIWFYECEREEAINENRLNRFLQEMPCTDDEAFQSTNISVFSTETITYYRDNAAAQVAQGIFGLVGPPEVLNPRLQPDRLARDPNKPTITVNAAHSTGYPIQFDLVPLRPVPLDDGLDKIYIYEMPVEGETYGFGMDTADGIDKDRTVIEGLRKYSINGPNKQILEYASGKCSALDSWPFLLAIGTLYSVADDRGLIQQPRMAIECRGHGDLPQNILRQCGWTAFHNFVDRQIDSRKQDLSKFTKIGIYTTSWFRDGLIALLVKMLRDAEIEISSPWFVQEMSALEGDSMIHKLQAGYGAHDDRFLALGFIIMSLLQFDSENFRSAKIAAYSGRSPISKPARPRQFATWKYGAQERSDASPFG